eukprot:m.265464 g.265464  ORF g.265464 m.265464 type:complete len:127 (+) comp19262_c1_seq3:205-585(+)
MRSLLLFHAHSDPTQSAAVFEQIKAGVSAALVKKTKAVFQFNITQGGKKAATWTVDLKNGDGAVHEGPPKSGKPGCTLTIADDDLVALTAGKLDAMKAFMSGKLKVSGNIMLAQKLSSLFSANAKL